MSGKTEDGMIPESEMSEDALQHMHECIAVVNGLIQQFDARILAGVLTSQAAKLYARLMAAGYYSQDQVFDVGMQFMERATRAVEAPKEFVIHDYPAKAACPVSCGIKTAMERVLDRTQDSMEQSLGEISLAQVIADVPR